MPGQAALPEFQCSYGTERVETFWQPLTQEVSVILLSLFLGFRLASLQLIRNESAESTSQSISVDITTAQQMKRVLFEVLARATVGRTSVATPLFRNSLPGLALSSRRGSKFLQQQAVSLQVSSIRIDSPVAESHSFHFFLFFATLNVLECQFCSTRTAVAARKESENASQCNSVFGNGSSLLLLQTTYSVCCRMNSLSTVRPRQFHGSLFKRTCNGSSA